MNTLFGYLLQLSKVTFSSSSFLLHFWWSISLTKGEGEYFIFSPFSLYASMGEKFMFNDLENNNFSGIYMNKE